jgi:predicted DNA-binding transcriptional regulator YafY
MINHRPVPPAALGLLAAASTPEERAQVLSILSLHQGIKQAITSRELSRLTGLPTRTIRQAIADLVDQGALIGASVEGVRGGYYMIVNRDELEQTRAILRARAENIFARDAALRRTWERTYGQRVQPLLTNWNQP